MGHLVVISSTLLRLVATQFQMPSSGEAQVGGGVVCYQGFAKKKAPLIAPAVRCCSSGTRCRSTQKVRKQSKSSWGEKEGELFGEIVSVILSPRSLCCRVMDIRYGFICKLGR